MNSPALSAGIVVVHQDVQGWLYLLLRAYQYWDFPKGMVEPGEEPLVAARRETREETTLENLLFNWGEIYYETDPYNHGRKVARYYLAASVSKQVTLPVSAELGRPEHDEFMWLDFSQARALVELRVSNVLHWAHAILEKKS